MIRRSAWACGAAARADTSDRVGAGLLQVAHPHVLVEQPALGGQDLQHPLVDAVLGEQAVDLDRSELTHAVAAGDGLLLDVGFHCGSQRHDRRRLDVQADAARLDLADEHRGVRVGGEVVDDLLARRRRDVAGEGPDAVRAERLVDRGDDVPEEREDDHLAAVLRPPRRRSPSGGRAWPSPRPAAAASNAARRIRMKFPSATAGAVGVEVGADERDPVLGLDPRRQLCSTSDWLRRR